MNKKQCMKLIVCSFMLYLTAFTGNASPINELERDLNKFYKQVKDRAVSKKGFASIFGVPSGTVGRHGSAYMSLMAATLPNGGTKKNPFDASAIVGFSIGDAEQLALGVNIGIISVNPVGSKQTFGVAEDGNINLKIAKRSSIFYRQKIDFALGLNNYLAWGAAQRLPGRGYLAASTPFTTKSGRPWLLSIGRYHSNDNFSEYFMGVGAGVLKNTSISAGLSNSSLTLGVSLVDKLTVNKNSYAYQLSFGFADVGQPNERFLTILSKPVSWSSLR